MIVFAGLAVKLKWQGAKFFFSYKRMPFTVHYSATLVVTYINFPSQRVDRGLISSESIKKKAKLIAATTRKMKRKLPEADQDLN